MFPLYLQRGRAQERAGVGHDVRNTRHVCLPHGPPRLPSERRGEHVGSCGPGAGHAGSCSSMGYAGRGGLAAGALPADAVT